MPAKTSFVFTVSKLALVFVAVSVLSPSAGFAGDGAAKGEERVARLKAEKQASEARVAKLRSEKEVSQLRIQKEASQKHISDLRIAKEASEKRASEARLRKLEAKPH